MQTKLLAVYTSKLPFLSQFDCTRRRVHRIRRGRGRRATTDQSLPSASSLSLSLSLFLSPLSSSQPLLPYTPDPFRFFPHHRCIDVYASLRRPRLVGQTQTLSHSLLKFTSPRLSFSISHTCNTSTKTDTTTYSSIHPPTHPHTNALLLSHIYPTKCKVD